MRRRTVLLSLSVAIWLGGGGARAKEPIRLPDGRTISQINFERHVAPLLSRLGCNAGSCHGASGGKGGFRLSLFGHDVTADHAAITEEQSGRADVENAAASLLLQKPSLTMDHEGGLRLPRGSWQYRLLARWIREGAKHEPGSGNLARLELAPAQSVLDGADSFVNLKVFATFDNGDREDVTSFSDLRVRDDAIATIDDGATARPVASGDTAIIATYQGRPVSAHLLVPRWERKAAGLSDAPSESSLIDRFILAKLRRLRIEPSPLATDEEFLRRVTLSTTGQLPAPGDIRQFLADKRPDRRRRVIDSLLSDPLHAAMWATRMCEITGSRDSGETSGEAETGQEVSWHGWLRERFARNMPYDQMAREILRGTSRDELAAADFVKEAIQAAASETTPGADSETTPGAANYADHRSLDLFWKRPTVNEEIDLDAVVERVSAAFLGRRIECARCHKHPFDRWTQNDHRSLANVFAQVRFGMSSELRAALVDALEEQRENARQGKPVFRVPTMREVYVARVFHDLRDPVTKEPLPAKPLGGEAIETQGDRREAFANWLTAADNPFFARNIVNRVWAWHFGVGLVEPVDAFSAGNPSLHPRLLDALAKDFVDHGFDIRRLERKILCSNTWQRTAVANETNQTDRHNFARAYVRVLPAAVVVDALRCAIGDRGDHAVELASFRAKDASVNTYFEIFNRPERQSTCDCERSSEPTLRQTMLLLSDPDLLRRIRAGHVERLAGSELSDRQIVDELFLLSLSRWPDEEERRAALEHVEASKERREGIAEVLWSLINTREFVTNH